jgi:hypothetical protein
MGCFSPRRDLTNPHHSASCKIPSESKCYKTTSSRLCTRSMWNLLNYLPNSTDHRSCQSGEGQTASLTEKWTTHSVLLQSSVRLFHCLTNKRLASIRRSILIKVTKQQSQRWNELIQQSALQCWSNTFHSLHLTERIPTDTDTTLPSVDIFSLDS